MKKLETNTEEINREKALVLKMQTGSDREKQLAFNALYVRHKEALFYKVLRAFKMDKNVAQDLTQEIFTKIYLNIGNYNPEFAFSTWLYKIANNHIIDTARKQEFEVLHLDSMSANYAGDDDNMVSKAFQLEDKGANGFELVVREERAVLLKKAIDNIKSAKEKKVIQSFFIEDKSHEEVSKEMGLPIGSVKALIFRAKDSLKKYLSKEVSEAEFTS